MYTRNIFTPWQEKALGVMYVFIAGHDKPALALVRTLGIPVTSTAVFEFHRSIHSRTSQRAMRCGDIVFYYFSVFRGRSFFAVVLTCACGQVGHLSERRPQGVGRPHQPHRRDHRRHQGQIRPFAAAF